MNLADLQSRVATLLEGIEHPRVGAALALAEECGEVMKWVVDREMYGDADASALEGEIGDVLVAVAELASRYGLSLDSAADGALEKLAEKAPHWREQLAGRLDAIRRRMDG